MKRQDKDFSALQNAENGGRIILPKAVYDIGLSDTVSRVYYPGNNDGGRKNIAFLYKNKENLVLDGNGSKLIFHGRISPFIFDKCRNITLKNFVIDYARPFFTQGEIVDCDDDHFDIRIDREKYPYRVEDEGIIFTAPEWEADLRTGINLFLPFDKDTRAPGYNSTLAIAVTGRRAEKDSRSPVPEEVFLVEEISPHTLRFKGNCRFNCHAGQWMTITHERRDNNIVSAFDCENVTFENIEMIHGGAMGILCQTCTDVTLRKIRCGAETEALVSLNCDATHFINCDGRVLIEDCDFFNMMDDAVNVHSIYTTVKSISAKKLVLELRHFQQHRLNVFRPGDELDIYERRNMRLKKRLRIKASRLICDSLIEISTEDNPDGVEPGDFAQNSERMPEVIVRGCRSGRNRPRGFLVSSPKKVLIENNEFENSSCGLFFTSDTEFWFEGTGVRDVLIRGNHFKNCGYHYGEFSICFSPALTAELEGEYFNRNITIENNRFETFTGGVLYVKDTENVIFRDNEIIHTEAYPQRRQNFPVECVHCKNVMIE